MSFKILISYIIFVSSLLFFNGSSLAEGSRKVSTKSSPEVTLDKVEDIFGSNLDTNDTTLKYLLLAIGMDHTSPNSPHLNQNIGVPYIVDRGPSYWVNRLNKGDISLEVLVNNSLLLLFSKEDIPKSQETALVLLKQASLKGYWPAEYYITEYNLLSHLMRDDTRNLNKSMRIPNGDLQILAKNTMKSLNRCSDIGFAPCQYRVGFWLANSDSTLKQGLNILRKAIKTTINDTRYNGILDGELLLAAKEIVFKGEIVGLDEVIRAKYVALIEGHVASINRELIIK